MMPTNEYIEVHNGGYYVAGTRIGLDVVTYDFRDGRSAEAIFDAYPSIGSLAKVYGAITFILEHPTEIEAYRYAVLEAKRIGLSAAEIRVYLKTEMMSNAVLDILIRNMGVDLEES